MPSNTFSFGIQCDAFVRLGKKLNEHECHDSRPKCSHCFFLFQRLSVATARIAFIIFVNLWVIVGASNSVSDTILLDEIIHSVFCRLAGWKKMWSRRKWKCACWCSTLFFALFVKQNLVRNGKIDAKVVWLEVVCVLFRKFASEFFPHISIHRDAGSIATSWAAEHRTYLTEHNNFHVFVWHIFVVFGTMRKSSTLAKSYTCLRKPISFVAYLCNRCMPSLLFCCWRNCHAFGISTICCFDRTRAESELWKRDSGILQRKQKPVKVSQIGGEYCIIPGSSMSLKRRVLHERYLLRAGKCGRHRKTRTR